jgi:hypothetical protein
LKLAPQIRSENVIFIHLVSSIVGAFLEQATGTRRWIRVTSARVNISTAGNLMHAFLPGLSFAYASRPGNARRHRVF